MQISYCTKQILAVVFLSVHIVKMRQAQSFILCYGYIYIYFHRILNNVNTKGLYFLISEESWPWILGPQEF